MVTSQGSPLPASECTLHSLCTQGAVSPLTQLFQPHSSSCSFLWLREPEASPEPWPPSTAKQLASITPDSFRATAQPPAPAWLSAVPFYGEAEGKQEVEGSRFGLGRALVKPRAASPLGRGPRTSAHCHLFFSSEAHSAYHPHDPFCRSQPFLLSPLPDIRGVISHLAQVPRLGF